MTDLADDLLFRRPGLTPDAAAAAVQRATVGCDDGELFLEHREEEVLTLDNGGVRDCTFRSTLGFGLRAMAGEAVGFAHGTVIDAAAIGRAADALAPVRRGHGGRLQGRPFPSPLALYGSGNPLAGLGMAEKLAALAEIRAYLLAREPALTQATAQLLATWQVLSIVRADGSRVSDVRPLVRLNVIVEAGRGGRTETGRAGGGGRFGYDRVLDGAYWRDAADEALRRVRLKLEAVPAPAGEMPVVVGPGWNGTLLHEAVGHGLEGDGVRKGTSAFAGMLGQRVAAPGVTVVDDGTMGDSRGSIAVDDEGTPAGRAVLIEDGIVTGWMLDRHNARLMGLASTGNGRRESAAFAPWPRMTNTIMLPGDKDPAEIIAAVDRGIYVANMSGGNVEEATTDFNFVATEAYLIENGRLTVPLKDVALQGKGKDVLKGVRMIGNDFALDGGVGTCGKAVGIVGQSVPIGVGQPTLLLDGMLVGGTG